MMDVFNLFGARLILALAAMSLPLEVRPESFTDRAWRYAGAITSDTHAQMAARHRVVDAQLDRGDITGASAHVESLAGWRKLAALARLAEWSARTGDTNETIRLGQEIEYQLPGLTGWEYTHTLAACLRVKALARDRAYISSITNWYDGNQKIAGLARAASVFIGADQAGMDTAMRELEALASSADYEVVLACVDFARMLVQSRPDAVISTNLVTSAVNLIRGVPGNRRVELLIDLLHDNGDRMPPECLPGLLELIQHELAGTAYPPHIQGPLWADFAIACATLEPGRNVAEEAVLAARRQIDSLMLIEQPQLKARIAEAEMLLGRVEFAHAMLHDAYKQAGELVNPRPRYSALVEVMLSSFRADLSPGNIMDAEPAE